MKPGAWRGACAARTCAVGGHAVIGGADSYGISVTTLEEVFLRVGRAEEDMEERRRNKDLEASVRVPARAESERRVLSAACACAAHAPKQAGGREDRGERCG